MTKRGAGVSFIAISAFFISSKYISAAIYGSNQVSWNIELFSGLLGIVGDTLTHLSILAFVIGVAYIIWGEYEEWHFRKGKSTE
ncbi:hypothetical protein [Lihuaxuella thermophila]|uniref:hypothetical protein n=1 Tax=Lihuaxuella thermophila TaxID=1173111 RepID=UPI000B7F6692|nr:hypothetical protein [Lihuaxuella thermophila]